MGCFQPGRIVVLPKDPKILPDGVLEFPAEGERSQSTPGGPVPVLLDVTVGHEVRECGRLRASGKVLAASPNFYLAPQAGPPTLNDDEIALLMSQVGVTATPTAGQGIKIAILDSGWTATSGRATGPVQHYANRPPRSNESGDLTGHGTSVIELIRSIAPRADTHSIRIMDSVGDLWSLLCGLSLAEAFEPDLINISASFSCDSGYCAYCKREGAIVEQIELLFWSIQKRRPPVKQPIIVAAAGNNETRCALPSSLTDVIAVGAYDFDRQEVPDYARYASVPAGRFIMAPGGARDLPRAFSLSSGHAGTQRPFYGTSFAAPIVTAIAALYLAEHRCEACRSFHGLPGARPIEAVLELMATSAQRPLYGYEPARHGLGIVNYSHWAADDLASVGRLERIVSMLDPYRDSLRAMVGEEARRVFEERGSPNGQADAHWHIARQRCGIPDKLHL